MTDYKGNKVPEGCEIVPVPTTDSNAGDSLLGYIVYRACMASAERAAKTFLMLGQVLTDDQMVNFIDHEIKHVVSASDLAKDLFQDHVEGIKFSFNLEAMTLEAGLTDCFVVEGLIVNSEKYWEKLQLEPSFKEASDILGVTFDRIAAESTVEHMLAMRTESEEE